jgi:hypothetical protein
MDLNEPKTPVFPPSKTVYPTLPTNVKAKPAKAPKKPEPKMSKVTIIKTKDGRPPREIPEVVAPVLVKSKITRKALASYLESVLVAFAPHLIPELMKSLLEGTVDGDLQSMKMTAEIYGMTAGNKGGTIVQVLQQNVTNAQTPEEHGYRRSVDNILRQQEQRKQLESGAVIDVTPQPSQENG